VTGPARLVTVHIPLLARNTLLSMRDSDFK
jgi:hypothetical protein